MKKDGRIFADAMNGSIEAVLGEVYGHYGHLVPGHDQSRFYTCWLPDEAEFRLPSLWPTRFLGPTMPPRHKGDGVHFALAKSAKFMSQNWDGVWDFADKYGLLLVHIGGLRVPDGAPHPFPLCYILATDVSDVRGFFSYLDRLASKYTRKERKVANLGHGPSSSGVRVSPEDVVLPGNLRDALLQDVDAFLGGERWYKEHNIPWKRSVLMYGEPGTGKTTVCKMLASRFLDRRRPAYSIAVERKTDLGDIAHAFDIASSNGPSLLILEDIDAVETSAIGRSGFLNVLDGQMSDSRRSVYLVGTTNHPEMLDAGLAGRPGRWDQTIHVPLPAASERRAYLSRKMESAPYADLLEALVTVTDGLTLAACQEVHYQIAMVARVGRTPTESDVRRIAREMKQVEHMKDSGRWEPSRERAVGFAPASSRGDADASPLTATSDD